LTLLYTLSLSLVNGVVNLIPREFGLSNDIVPCSFLPELLLPVTITSLTRPNRYNPSGSCGVDFFWMHEKHGCRGANSMKTGKLKAILSKTPFVILPLLLGALYLSTHEIGSSAVLKEAEKIYIVDRTGERWDVTQAVSLGFNPEGFQFGLGRNAFTTLDDSLLTNDTSNISKNARVIGVTDGSTAKAYTISRLLGHEISNSSIGSEPVAVSY
jgi:hypothetical protein